MSDFNNAYTPPDISAILGTIDTSLRHKSKNGAARGYEKYHPSAFGKAQPLNALIQTPYGPVKMGDIKIGDEVCGIDGNINTVIQIHPQGTKSIYRISFTDGTTADCCADHLWEIDSVQLGFVKPKVLSTSYLIKNYLSPCGSRNFSVRLPKPIKMKNKYTGIITPYILGVILGDGCLRCGGVDFTTIDDNIVERIRSEIITGYEVKSRSYVQHRICKLGSTNLYNRELKRLGLKGLKTLERFIPNEYLYVREIDRWNLIQGLLDTDGTVSKFGHVSFSTSSPKMANQVKWLIESLGGICKIYLKPTKKLTNYICYIRHSESWRLFSLPRKVERAKLRPKKNEKRIIKNISLIGEQEAQCITVSNTDGLYLTDSCIVTHNCLRNMQYLRYMERGYINVEQAEQESKLTRLFDKGHNMHSRWAKYAENMGILRGYWECANPTCSKFDDSGVYIPEANMEKPRVYGRDNPIGCFKPTVCSCGCSKFEYHEVDVFEESLNFYGHCDMIWDFSNFSEDKFKGIKASFDKSLLPSGPIVVDMKTCNDYKFSSVLKKGPGLDYRIQLTIYANILPVEFGLLIYENKNNSEVAAYKIEKNTEAIYNLVKTQAKQMNEMVEMKLLPPPRPSNKDDYECSSCPFRKICHKSKIWADEDLTVKRKNFYGNLI